MDKLTKSAEVNSFDSSSLEEETSKKSKVTKVIALVISLLLAVAIWLYVVETDETIFEEEFVVDVEILNADSAYEITANDVTVVVKGTTSQLVDIDKSDIIVKVDMDSLEKPISVGKVDVKAEVSVSNDSSVTIKNPESITVTLDIKAK